MMEGKNIQYIVQDEKTTLSLQRTALSYERTLQAWIRTAMSMISFGFTLYKFFEEVSEKANAEGRILTPRLVGMIMIAFGFLGLLVAHIQHNIGYKKLKRDYPKFRNRFHQS
jgi:putative membrane protein